MKILRNKYLEFVFAHDPDLGKLFQPCLFPWDDRFAPLGGALEYKLESLFQSYVLFGGYPAVTLTKDEIEKKILLRSLVDSYLLKDIRGLLRLATEKELLILLKLLAGQIGNLIHYRELCNASTFNFRILKKHLYLLENTYIIELLSPFFRNRRIELIKNPKIYFFDTGLRNILLEQFLPLRERVDTGALVENSVFIGLRHAFPPPAFIRFWRTKTKAEVDFIFEKDGMPIPLEVQYSSNPTLSRSFRNFLETHQPKEAFMATRGIFQKFIIKNTMVKFIPVWYWC